jgi:hypothetical protein
MPPAPANSPSLTPSNPFPDISLFHNCDDAFTATSAAFPGVDPGSSPSSSSIPTFDLSLTSDSSDCPDEDLDAFQLSNSPSISSDHAILTPENLPKGVGLGIMGVSKHDGTGEFDGIGLVSIRQWTIRPACLPREANPFQLSESLPQGLEDEVDMGLSETFLREAEMTFIRDPFHNHSLATIPECQSFDLGEGATSEPLSIGIKDGFEGSHALPVSDKLSASEKAGSLRRMKKHFSASTISSELKRTSVPTSIRRVNFGETRTRSSTWPSHACSRVDRASSGDGVV